MDCQRHASFSGEFRVKPEDFDCEGNPIGDALARTMSAAEQFQIGDGVVLPVAINVMNRLFGHERAAQVLFHDPAVLQHFAFFAARDIGRNGEPDVSVALDVPTDLARNKSLGRLCHLRRYLAFLPAVFLLGVNATSWLAPAAHCFAAVRTGEDVSFFRRFAASKIGAGRRAVHRIVTELLSVSREVSLHHRKFFAALLAGEWDLNSAWSRQILLKTVGASAGKAAIFSSYCNFAWVAVERTVAVLANHLDRHVGSPWVQRLGISHVSRGASNTFALAG